MTETRSYGAWESPVTASLITGKGVGLSQVHLGPDAVSWVEGRPREGGRCVLVRRPFDGSAADVTPAGWNVRTRVHEYGGGAVLVHGDAVTFAEFSDQRLYRQAAAPPHGEPRPITPAPAREAALRYADLRAFRPGGDGPETVVAVRERHEEGAAEAANELVAFPADGSAAPRVLVSGNDFYAAPRVRPDGKRLAWLTWSHPDMPWDRSELWEAEVTPAGTLGEPRRVAGGPGESVVQPQWSPEGRLHFLSDRSGWWNLYAAREDEVAPLAPVEAELGRPSWVFGMSTYAFLSGGRIACIVTSEGKDQLGLVAPGSGRIEPLDLPWTSYAAELRSDGGSRLACVAGSAREAPAVVLLDVDRGEWEVLRRSLDVDLDPGFISEPEHLEFPTTGDRRAHALFYRPQNRDFRGPPGKAPPLLVMSHGGPTASARSDLSLGIQFWTSRGFAVVDVDYGGSSGYGRAYRQRLEGRWGEVDVDDCVAAARHLEGQGRVDGRRMAIRGGSAGGFTTLCALVFRDVFAAGASHFGVADLEALAKDTHKFESRYGDRLVGPYPERADLYRERSPIHHAERLSCPVILLQGLEDRVVPPEQAEVMVRALQAKGLPYAYLTFPGEQHGFRAAESIRRAIEGELAFYGRVFGFEPAGDVEPIEVHNL